MDAEFLRVDRLAKAGELPDASIVDGVLKIIPPDDQEPEELEQLTRQAYAMLPRIKITDLLFKPKLISMCDDVHAAVWALW